ncbi:DUF6933 domain-containing protein [Oerskovia sp. USHLN155]|uniref:DUF6933 domain-containing protein n=1 Tax=Oerskovia sp. USHLN155 TaxID=3081288 RepID=UPI003FA54B97
MLVLRTTKKLRDKIDGVPPESREEPTTRLGDWCASHVPWRPQHAILINGRTLLPTARAARSQTRNSRRSSRSARRNLEGFVGPLSRPRSTRPITSGTQVARRLPSTARSAGFRARHPGQAGTGTSDPVDRARQVRARVSPR